MVLHPKFYQRPDIAVCAEREKIGLSPQKLTGLVMFGGNGSPAMLDIAQSLENHKDLQLIFLCGNNEELASSLRQLPNPQNKLIVSFTEEVPYYMQLADFFVGKPGPGSLSEALMMNLPIITERSRATLIHERYNTEWVEEKQVGVVVKNFKKTHQAIAQFLDPTAFNQYQKNALAYQNNSIFELAELIRQQLTSPPTQTTVEQSLPALAKK